MRSTHGHDHELAEFDLGLAHDLQTLASRRRVLGFLGGAAATVALVACGSSGSDGAASSTTAAGAGGAASTTSGSAGSSGEVIPEETAGPYPGDGSNGPDALSTDGVVREDITTSFGDASGVAGGIPLTIAFALQDTSGAAREGLAVYAWHCTAEGGYSMYSAGVEDENFLRGVQATGSDGVASFTSVFPGCYDGRWPHVHFEVYESVDDAIGGGSPIATSQIALPEDISTEVYGADDRYSASVANLQRVSLESDMVFQDSYEQELGTMSGTIGDGLTVTLAVPV